MGFSSDDLVWKALLAIEEVAEQYRNEPGPPSFLLRFALAYLFEASGAEPSKKWIFDGFWREIINPPGRVVMADYCRSRDIECGLNGIWREVGCERSFSAILAMRAALQRSTT